jgi:DNA-binding transcriptional MerR regulator
VLGDSAIFQRNKLSFVTSEEEVKILELLMRETLPQRNFFRASEVSDLLKIKPHEMRYWETEFPQVRPQKTRTGQRIYRRQDVILFSAIRHLLQEKKLSLASAQRIIAESDDLFQTQSYKIDEKIPALDESKAPKSLDVFLETDLSLVLEETPEEIDLPKKAERDDRLLSDAAKLLDEKSKTFDSMTQDIYFNYGSELDQVFPKVNDETVGSLLHEVMVEKKAAPVLKPPTRHPYEKTVAILMESKNSLHEILGMLEKFHESDFWHGFKG